VKPKCSLYIVLSYQVRPREPGRRLSQDAALFPERLVLAAELAQLLPLLRGQTVVASAVIPVGWRSQFRIVWPDGSNCRPSSSGVRPLRANSMRRARSPGRAIAGIDGGAPGGDGTARRGRTRTASAPATPGVPGGAPWSHRAREDQGTRRYGKTKQGRRLTEQARAGQNSFRAAGT
jgi:hypothetical protein